MVKLTSEETIDRFDAHSAAGKESQVIKDIISSLATALEAMEAARVPDVERGLDFYREVERFEVNLIQRALRQTGGNQARAARLLNLKQTTLHGKIKQYNIHPGTLFYMRDDSSLSNEEYLNDEELVGTSS